ncbi:hypothetical protein A4X06_0g994 [Tilletia controversa]|uniref:Uncharacterized protein n=1 Tax=Tilletia controversa TaxID=13291 RepID=A0A8X7T056_9BASI|nr:hypothetical protein CF328_g892 [Tilletia controversa]KAE8254244.1 hypothetical protein A4X06_0g994 [Tilletia controversa]
MFAERLATPPPSSSLPNSPGAGTGAGSHRTRGPTPTALGSHPGRSNEAAHQHKRRRTQHVPHASSSSPAYFFPISPRSPTRALAVPQQAKGDTANTGNGNGNGKTRLVIKGTVTPSRAAPFFQLRPAPPSSPLASKSSSQQSSQTDDRQAPAQVQASPRSVMQLCSPTPRRINRAFTSTPRHGDTRTEYLQSLLRRPPPAASTLFTAGNPALTVRALRTLSNPLQLGASLPTPQAANSRGLYGRPTHAINTRAYLSSFASREQLDSYELESSWQTNPASQGSSSFDPAIAHPLCCAYSYSSKAAEPSAQWLAIGDNEGRIILLNTLDDSTADEFTGPPQWRVTGRDLGIAATGPPPSVFELAWRQDDVLLASSASNYSVAVWDVSTHACTDVFAGPQGSARSIQWDPNGGGNLLCSGGRDGAIHFFDRRVRPGESGASSGPSDEHGEAAHFSENDMPAAVQPVLSIWSAHTSSVLSKSKSAPKHAHASAGAQTTRPSRFTTTTAGGRKRTSQPSAQRGVTSLSYIPGRPHCVVSAGCEDGRVRVWDWRAIVPAAKVTPVEESVDVSRRGNKNLSSHGISSLAVGNGTIFAACTDANIYALNASSFVAGLPATSSVLRQASVSAQALYHPMQRGNTLYAKLALDPQEQILAVGCNSGKVVLYDVKCRAGLGAGGSDMSSAMSVALEGGHLPHSEINGVSWAHGPQGPTLTTIADDFTVRTWRPDRAFSDPDDGVAPLELESDEEFEWEAKERRVWRGASRMDAWGEEEEEEEYDGSSDDSLDASPVRYGRSTSGCRFGFDSE